MVLVFSSGQAYVLVVGAVDMINYWWWWWWNAVTALLVSVDYMLIRIAGRHYAFAAKKRSDVVKSRT